MNAKQRRKQKREKQVDPTLGFKLRPYQVKVMEYLRKQKPIIFYPFGGL